VSAGAGPGLLDNRKSATSELLGIFRSTSGSATLTDYTINAAIGGVLGHKILAAGIIGLPGIAAT